MKLSITLHTPDESVERDDVKLWAAALREAADVLERLRNVPRLIDAPIPGYSHAAVTFRIMRSTAVVK